MNEREFVKKLFSEIWEPGAKVKHNMKGIFQRKRYTYEETIKVIQRWKEDYKRSPRINAVTNVELYYDRVTNGMQCIRCKDLFPVNDNVLLGHVEKSNCWNVKKINDKINEI
jgi:hypothetical protein